MVEFMRDAAIRCDRLARTCSNEYTKLGLESLSLELAEKARELQTDSVPSKGLLMAPNRLRLRSSPLGGGLNIVTVITVLLTAIDFWLRPPHLVFAYLFPILFVAVRYGVAPAVFSLIASVLYAAFIFYPPKFTFYFDQPQQLLELLFFSGVAFLAIQIVTEQVSSSGRLFHFR